MSRRDRYHKIVRDALEDDGWTITHDPYYFETDPVLATDLGAERTLAAERGNEKIAVEVKSFLRGSQVVVLEQAIGQYFLYEEFLKIQEPERVLYLAVPTYAYEDIFASQVGQLAVQKLGLRLIVYSLEEGEGLQWPVP